ncbi:hypothetical protein ASL10_04590 [Frigoribacterium sp. Leaf8]|nr:hypothetical protein ASL10_04590 [Frigoribacterium sp. Leaf8]
MCRTAAKLTQELVEQTRWGQFQLIKKYGPSMVGFIGEVIEFFGKSSYCRQSIYIDPMLLRRGAMHYCIPASTQVD